MRADSDAWPFRLEGEEAAPVPCGAGSPPYRDGDRASGPGLKRQETPVETSIPTDVRLKQAEDEGA